MNTPQMAAAAAMGRAYGGNSGTSYGARMGEAMSKAYGNAAKAAGKKSPSVAPTPPLRKPQAANTQTVNIHINADGMGNKEAAALIDAEIKKEMAALDRKQKAAARSAFYDAHA